jgi:hypothetical protein
VSGGRLDSEDRLTAQKAKHPELDAESAVVFLHQLGVDKFESIIVIRRVFNISLGDAKKLVHLSSAWGFRRADDDAFHDAAIAVLDSIDTIEDQRSE